MSNYTILTKYEHYEIREHDGRIVEASVAIDWSIGLPFEHVRTYCERKGWRLVPDVEDTRTHIVEFRGVKYELIWNENRINSITADGEEITWQELPEQVKGLL